MHITLVTFSFFVSAHTHSMHSPSRIDTLTFHFPAFCICAQTSRTFPSHIHFASVTFSFLFLCMNTHSSHTFSTAFTYTHSRYIFCMCSHPGAAGVPAGDVGARGQMESSEGAAGGRGERRQDLHRAISGTRPSCIWRVRLRCACSVYVQSCLCVVCALYVDIIFFVRVYCVHGASLI